MFYSSSISACSGICETVEPCFRIKVLRGRGCQKLRASAGPDAHNRWLVADSLLTWNPFAALDEGNVIQLLNQTLRLGGKLILTCGAARESGCTELYDRIRGSQKIAMPRAATPRA